MKQIYLLLVCQGFYLGSVCQRWTFPEEISAVIGSCVEIPCTYDPAGRSGASSAVWYLSAGGSEPEILNTKDPSSVRTDYRDRTSLVPGDNSCSLRIDPVRREDGDRYYYPGIAEDGTIHATNRFVYLSVTAEEPKIELDFSNSLTEGKSTIIRCTVEHTCRSSPPTLQLAKPGHVQHRSVDISGGSWREESELTYIPSYVDDGTIIRCSATYPNGRSFHESGTLNINYSPKNVTVIVLGKDEVMEGSDVTLQCSRFSRPDVYVYEWYKGKDKTKLPETGQEITVRNVTRDTEPYSCIAINYVGRGESALTEIPVLLPYAATGVHINVKKESEVTELICDFLSSRPDVTHYTWMKDGSILQDQTRKTLTIENNVENNGRYSCIAHNSVGNSSSDEIYHNEETWTLPLIGGAVAGGFLLLLFILTLYLCVRRKKKSSSIHGTSTTISNESNMAKDDNQQGNNAQSSSLRTEHSVDVNFAGNQVIYSNSVVTQPSNEVEYSVISHRQHNQAEPNSSRVRCDENVEYAALKL